MGLLSAVAFAPVRFVAWVSERILEVAESEYHDESAILAALALLNDDYDRGLVDEETFAAAEDELMQRLEIARTRNGQ
ncbi:MAG TPA: gas vesicle protein GvpG [Nitriliruptorales bacterium]|nr:gas vesicle protein GvpG [Nitriliruptorales bacterium]